MWACQCHGSRQRGTKETFPTCQNSCIMCRDVSIMFPLRCMRMSHNLQLLTSCKNFHNVKVFNSSNHLLPLVPFTHFIVFFNILYKFYYNFNVWKHGASKGSVLKTRHDLQCNPSIPRYCTGVQFSEIKALWVTIYCFNSICDSMM